MYSYDETKEKLKIFEAELEARQIIADRYTQGLKDVVQTPVLMDKTTSAWAQYTMVLPKFVNRDQLMQDLKSEGIPTFIYYIKPLHLQTAYKHFPTASSGGLPICENLANRVLSLPMHPYLEEDVQERIIESIRDKFTNSIYY